MAALRPLLLLLWLVVAMPLAAEQAPATPAEGDAGTALFDEVWRTAKDHFYGAAVSEADWQRLRDSHRPAPPGEKAGEGGGEDVGEEVAARIDRMLSELGASHTARYTPDDVAYYHLLDIFRESRPLRARIERLFPGGEPRYSGLAAFFAERDGRTFIAGLWQGGSAEQAGLSVGDEILAADGEPFAPIRSFRGKAGRRVMLTLRRAAGAEPEQVAVIPEEIRPRRALLEAQKRSARIVEQDGRRIGYMRVWSYAGREYQEALVAALSEGPLKDAEALLLDLRGGWGGASPEDLWPFLPGPEMTFRSRGAAHWEAVSFKWRRPVGLLVDAGTRSGKEMLAHAFRAYGIGPVIGERTAGAVLAGRVFPLSDDSILYLAVADVRVDGTRLEGAGVEPDIVVPFDLPYARGADPRRDRGVEELARRLRP